MNSASVSSCSLIWGQFHFRGELYGDFNVRARLLFSLVSNGDLTQSLLVLCG
jgi:hypothetical protein